MASALGAPRLVLLLALALLPACAASPVQWDAERAERARAGAMDLSPDGQLVPDSLTADSADLALPSAACPGSLALARAGRTLFAVWWSPRHDSTALLASAFTSDHGAHWSPVVAVDSTDHGASGCVRAPPAIAADAGSGYVHIVYSMLAPEGPGLFFSHSMDGGASFHSPVPILYGERLGRMSVAADGNLVIVGFEDPNSRTPRIGLALSRTMGHIFEDRLLPVSDDNGEAVSPLVSIRGHRMAVAWREAGGATAPTYRIRTGTVP
ncbi:MAG: sialidase family protein [bacterium]